MAARVICLSEDVLDGGSGVRFDIKLSDTVLPAFVIRHQGRVRAFLNQCGHVPAQLDWRPGEFFDYSKLYLVCSIHGALYSPEDGRCLSGRCHGVGLKPLSVVEIDGQILLQSDSDGKSAAI